MPVTPFVPIEFSIPETLTTDEFVLRMLTINDVVKDFDAVTTSVDHCRTIWGGKWPEGLTLEQNLIDLGWHQKEFQMRRSFTYTVVAPNGEMVLGCVYLLPTCKAGFDAEVYLWIRQSHLASGMETRLYEAVRHWVDSAWPFKSVAYPGRSISLVDWKAI
jgi:hypothetical protein